MVERKEPTFAREVQRANAEVSESVGCSVQRRGERGQAWGHDNTVSLTLSIANLCVLRSNDSRGFGCRMRGMGAGVAARLVCWRLVKGLRIVGIRARK